jgi:hypothetical protein
VLSDLSEFNTSRHTVMAMITTVSNASWPLDISIQDLESAGLKHLSTIRAIDENVKQGGDCELDRAISWMRFS